MLDPALVPLPEEFLRWGRVLTHVHTTGNSECSNQQTAAQVVETARFLGYDAVMLNEHTARPDYPPKLSADSRLLEKLHDHAAVVGMLRVTQRYPIFFGLECNTVATGGLARSLDLPVDHDLPVRYLVASLHGQASEYQCGDVIWPTFKRLCEDDRVDTIGHPTRYVNDVPLNWYDIGRLAADTGTILEINSRLWLKEVPPGTEDSVLGRFWRRVLEQWAAAACMVIIGDDIHCEGHFPGYWPNPDWEYALERGLIFQQWLTDAGFTPERMAGATYARFNWVTDVPKAYRAGLLDLYNTNQGIGSVP